MNYSDSCQTDTSDALMDAISVESHHDIGGSLPAVERAIRFRQHLKGYMSDYYTALAIVRRETSPASSLTRRPYPLSLRSGSDWGIWKLRRRTGTLFSRERSILGHVGHSALTSGLPRVCGGFTCLRTRACEMQSSCYRLARPPEQASQSTRNFKNSTEEDQNRHVSTIVQNV